MKFITNFVKFLKQGTKDNVLHDAWYNTGAQNIIILIILSFTGYSSLEYFQLDASGLKALFWIITIILGVILALIVFFTDNKVMSIYNRLFSFTDKLMMAIFSLFLVFFNPDSLDFFDSSISSIKNGLITLDYSIDKSFILTAETIATIGLILFAYQCLQVAKYNNSIVLSRARGKFTLVFFTALLISKPIFSFSGGEYTSFGVFAVIALLAFSIQKYLLYYINSNNLSTNDKFINFKNIIHKNSFADELNWISLISIGLLSWLMDVSYIFMGLFMLYAVISFVMYEFKSIYNNIITISLCIVTLLYSLVLMFISFIEKSIYFFQSISFFDEKGTLTSEALFLIMFGLMPLLFMLWLLFKSNFKIFNKYVMHTLKSFFYFWMGILVISIIFTTVPDKYETNYKNGIEYALKTEVKSNAAKKVKLV